jgi:hypothetical protein
VEVIRMTATTVPQQGRFGPYLVIAPAMTALAAFASALTGSVGAVAIGAGIGLAWSLLVGWLSGWIGQRAGWERPLANGSVFGAVLAATTLFGGSLYAMMLMAPVLSSPDIVLGFMRPPVAAGFTFFVIFNSLMEWVVIPTALYLNWRMPRRRTLIIVAAVLYYGARVWTYVYFVPTIFDFMTLPAGEPLSAELVGRVTWWVNLSWIRTAIDGLMALLFLLAASRPGPSRTGQVRATGEGS